jgi:AraC-like DNA-binding protein
MEFFPLGLLPGRSGVAVHEIGYLRRNDWWLFPNTLSPFWRLYFNFRRGHKVIFPNAEYELEPRYIVLIPDHRLFHSHGLRPVPHFWINFQVARRLDPKQPVPILLRATKLELGLLAKVRRLFKGIGLGDREQIYHLGLALLHLVLSRPEVRWRDHPIPDSVQKAIRTIETQYAAPLQIQFLAQRAGLSIRGLAKAFKREAGVTPHAFLTRVRVREAANRLANTDQSLEQIAAGTGFATRHHLSRIFRAVIGQPPARFRHQHRK